MLKLSERLKLEKFRFFCNTINAGVTATMATAPLPLVDAGQPAYVTPGGLSEPKAWAVFRFSCHLRSRSQRKA